MLFENVFRELNSSGIEYVVIGGIAVNLHGFARTTGDLDIIISLTNREIGFFVNVVKKLGFVPKVPVKIEELADSEKRNNWINEKNMKVFSVYNPDYPLEQIDLLMLPGIEIEEIIKNRIIFNADGIQIPVASIDDLIRLKERAGRERDNIDIKALKIISDYKHGR